MSYSTRRIIRTVTLFAFTLSCNILMAQNPGDPGGDPDVPIDGGILLLAGAGVAYGVKVVKNKRNRG